LLEVHQFNQIFQFNKNKNHKEWLIPNHLIFMLTYSRNGELISLFGLIKNYMIKMFLSKIILIILTCNFKTVEIHQMYFY